MTRSPIPYPDPESLAAVFATARPTLLAILARYRIPPADAEDLLQEAALALVLHWPRIHHHQAWLAGALRRAVFLYFRRQRYFRARFTPLAEQHVDLPSAAPPPDRRDAQLDLDRLIALLPPGQRLALFLRYRLGMRLPEAAACAGYRSESLRKEIHRALCRLRELLAARGSHPIAARCHKR